MLVRFTCDAHHDVLMFGDIARALLALLGHSETTPGALAADEVAPALARLQQALAAGHASLAPATAQADNEAEDDRSAPIPLATRALPLIELLTAADKAEARVLWYSV